MKKARAVEKAFESLADEVARAIAKFEGAHGVRVRAVRVEHMDDTGAPMVSVDAGVEARNTREYW